MRGSIKRGAGALVALAGSGALVLATAAPSFATEVGTDAPVADPAPVEQPVGSAVEQPPVAPAPGTGLATGDSTRGVGGTGTTLEPVNPTQPADDLPDTGEPIVGEPVPGDPPTDGTGGSETGPTEGTGDGSGTGDGTEDGTDDGDPIDTTTPGTPIIEPSPSEVVTPPVVAPEAPGIVPAEPGRVPSTPESPRSSTPAGSLDTTSVSPDEPTPSASKPNAPSLAATGAEDASGLLAAGLALVLVGGTFFVRRRDA